MIVELTNQKSTGQAGRLAILAVVVVLSQMAVWRPNPFLFGGLQLFSLLRTSALWMSPPNIMKTNLFYLKSTDLNVNHI